MLDFTFQNSPVKLFFGESKLGEVIGEIKRHGTKVMLVFGGSSFVKNGYYQPFVSELTKVGITYIDFDGITYPSLAKVRDGIKICRDEKVECVIGIGGGTCMDVAKAIAFGAMQDEDIWKFMTYEISEEGRPHLPVGTIVTYPSSSSEMTGSAQIDEDETGEKVGLSFVTPNFAWLNPEFMMSIGNTPFAYGQLTALVQGSLGYLSLERAELTETMTAALLKSILINLERSINDPTDKEARSNLLLTTVMNMSGITFFGKSGDWILIPISTILRNYLDVSYTEAMTIVFPYFLEEIYDGDPVFKAYFQDVLGMDVAGMSDDKALEVGLNAIWDIYRKFGVAIKFSELKQPPADTTSLMSMIAEVGEMPSQYGAFTQKRFEKILIKSTYQKH